jgi:hypothetical protein
MTLLVARVAFPAVLALQAISCGLLLRFASMADSGAAPNEYAQLG